jgi:hypothetical protein
MLGTTHGWAFIWAMGLGLVGQLPVGLLNDIYKKSTGAAARRIEQLSNKPTGYFLL